jgi:predicted metal-dependent peptidase
MACDYVINIKITDDNKDGFATAPDGVLLDDKYRGMDSAEVFHLIYSEQPKGGQSDKGESLDSHDWDGAQDMTAEESRQLERDIDNAVRQGALSAGKIDGADTRDIDALMEPEVDWQSQLRQFVQETCVGDDFMTWERPNRRFIGQDVYLPSELSETMNELVIGIDTSMSISQAEVTKFLSEVQGIVLSVRPHILRLIYWDDAVRNVEVYEQNQLETLVTSTKPEGGGCTEPECVSKYIKDNGLQVDAVVMMTDGYISNWGQWSVPTLWACTRDHNVSPVGKTIHIKL